jgi:hypothetical protein
LDRPIFFGPLGNANDARMGSRAWCGQRPGTGRPPSTEKAGRRFWNMEDVMFKTRIIVFAAAVALATWAAAVFAQSSVQLPDFVPPHVDTLSLLSQAGDLPIEIAPEI